MLTKLNNRIDVANASPTKALPGIESFGQGAISLACHIFSGWAAVYVVMRWGKRNLACRKRVDWTASASVGRVFVGPRICTFSSRHFCKNWSNLVVLGRVEIWLLNRGQSESKEAQNKATANRSLRLSLCDTLSMVRRMMTTLVASTRDISHNLQEMAQRMNSETVGLYMKFYLEIYIFYTGTKGRMTLLG